MRRFLQWLQPAGAYAWRWLGGMPAVAAPRPGAARSAPRRTAPPPGTVPPLPTSIIAEIRWDLRELRAEWCELRVRRALRRELREVERQIVAEHDAGQS